MSRSWTLGNIFSIMLSIMTDASVIVRREESHRLPVGYLFPPTKVWSEGNLLCAAIGRRRAPNRPDRTFLANFIEHSQSGNEAILRFAKRWGVLGICMHGLPASHSGGRELDLGWFGWEKPDWPVGGCWPVTRSDLTTVEPFAAWRRLGERLGALCSIATSLQNDGLGRLDDWQKVYGPWPIRGREYPALDSRFHPFLDPTLSNDEIAAPSWGRTRGQQRHSVACCTNNLLSLVQVRADVSWGSRGPATFTLGVGSGIFGALVWQLVLFVGESQNLEECSECGVPYLPKRKPRSGQDHFCEGCGRRAACRRAQKRYEGKLRANDRQKTARSAGIR
jgi:hypothetical protein